MSESGLPTSSTSAASCSGEEPNEERRSFTMDPLRETTEPTDVQEIYGSDGTRTRDLRRSQHR